MLSNIDKVAAITTLSKSTIYRLIKEDFPKPIHISRMRVGWREADIDAWLASRLVAGSRTK